MCSDDDALPCLSITWAPVMLGITDNIFMLLDVLCNLFPRSAPHLNDKREVFI
uniref:Uncharacterized protein n=1 Tax=Rhizophora mucronata TaxID=61149 RepID=A0A2P2PQW5_RHIMU